MGRELKRVVVNFEWPLHKVWEGFKNPFYKFYRECPFCSGSGVNEATKKIYDDWYAFDDRSKEWSHKITQDEVQALVDHNRLQDFTHTFVKGEGWVKKDPPYIPTAEEVNEWSKKGFGHDGINHWICVETRATRLGVYGKCEFCHGEGELWLKPEYKIKAEEWEKEEPPSGEWYQMWETVSEGSPISPAFETPEELARWLAENDTSVSRSSYETWLKFINGPGWAMTMMSIGGELMSGVEASCRLNVASGEGTES